MHQSEQVVNLPYVYPLSLIMEELVETDDHKHFAPVLYEVPKKYQRIYSNPQHNSVKDVGQAPFNRGSDAKNKETTVAMDDDVDCQELLCNETIYSGGDQNQMMVETKCDQLPPQSNNNNNNNTNNNHLKSEALDALLALLGSELRYGVVIDYLQTIQTDVKEWMREKVVQWIFECCDDLEMERNTAYTAVLNFDRFMSQKNVTKKVVQLVAVASILVSSKLYEHEPPYLDELRAATENAYHLSDIRAMEIYMMEKLEWKIRVVTPHHVLNQLFTTFPAPKSTVPEHARFFIDMSFGDYEFTIHFSPRIAAFASAILALNQLDDAYYQAAANWTAQVKSVCHFEMDVVYQCRNWLKAYFSKHFCHLAPQATPATTPLKTEHQNGTVSESPNNVTDQMASFGGDTAMLCQEMVEPIPWVDIPQDVAPSGGISNFV